MKTKKDLVKLLTKTTNETVSVLEDVNSLDDILNIISNINKYSLKINEQISVADTFTKSNYDNMINNITELKKSKKVLETLNKKLDKILSSLSVFKELKTLSVTDEKFKKLFKLKRAELKKVAKTKEEEKPSKKIKSKSKNKNKK